MGHIYSKMALPIVNASWRDCLFIGDDNPTYIRGKLEAVRYKTDAYISR